MNRSVPSSSVVPASARPASVSVVQAASAAAASAATRDGRPAGGHQLEGRPWMSTGPKPTAPRRARASMVVRRDAELDGPASARSRPTRRPEVLGAQANLVLFVEEGEVVRPQPVVAEDDVRVAVHVELDEGHLLVEAAQDQPGLDRAAGRAGRPVRLPDG
jgi:hypothetical protein